MRLATQLTTYSYYSQREAVRHMGLRLNSLPVSYLGVPDPFANLPEKNGSPVALTVGNVWAENLWRKGLEPFVRAAAFLPGVQFILAGAWKDRSIERLRGIDSPNVRFTGWLEDEDLFDYYRRAHVYVQPSAHEGFGMSVAEAMLAGCIPVVTRQGSLPEVVDTTGEYASSQEPEHVANAIRRALAAGTERRRAARERILTHFTLENRQRALVEQIQRLA